MRSLQLQGGPFSEGEADEFIRHPGGEAAVRLRRWDENAKVKDLVTPPLGHFRPYVEDCIRSGAVAAE